MTTEAHSLSRVRRFLADSEGPVALGDAEQESRIAMDGGAITVLEHLAAFRVDGSDAGTFLQGQLSCDLSALATGRTRLGAWCTPRGRVRALLQVSKQRGGLHCEIERALSEPTLAGLRRYVLRADVNFAPLPESTVRLGFAGETAAEWLENQWGPLPSGPDEQTRPALGVSIRRLQGRRPRWEMWGDEGDAQRLWSLACARLTPVGTAAWRMLDIAAGLPTIDRASSERYLPQMLNLDALEGVSFSKGCYPGQEVVARAQHLGKVKRRLYVARVAAVPAGAPSPRGATILALGDGSSAGEVLDAAPDPRGGWLISAVLSVAAADAGLCLDAAGRPTLALQSLPYGMPD